MPEPASSPPELVTLAHESVSAGTAIVTDAGGRPHVTIPPPPPAAGLPAEPLLGVRCGPSVQAVAYPAEVVVHDGAGLYDAVVGIAVDRRGRTAVAAPGAPGFLTPAGESDVAVDIGLRSLGLTTPPSDLPVEAFVERLWLDRILELVLGADLGDPPGWREISRSHPWSELRVCSPEHLRAARSAVRLDWPSCRRAVAEAGSGAVMSPSLAHWFDDGSFARRLLAGVPEPEPVLADLDELLRPHHAEWIRAALRPTLRIT